MRKNQVSITVERFGVEGLPEWLEYDGEGHQIIRVYADSNNIFEALAAANDEVMRVIKEGTRANIGARKEHYYGPETYMENSVRNDWVAPGESGLPESRTEAVERGLVSPKRLGKSK
jgi:hypothetical protein